MKLITQKLLIVALSLSSLFVSGQILSEDFTDGIMPPNGWEIVKDNSNDNWQINLNDEYWSAGGELPEARFFFSEGDTPGYSRLISPQLDTDGLSVLKLEFKQQMVDFGSGYSISVETTSDGANFTQVWVHTAEDELIQEDIPQETRTVFISNDDVGSETFRLSFTFHGDFSEIGEWHIDDIILENHNAVDVACKKVIIPDQIPKGENITPKAIVENLSSEAVSFAASFEILDGGNVIYSSEKDINSIGPVEEEEIEFDVWNANQAGNFVAKVNLEMDGDENTSNNILFKNVEVVENSMWKKQLLELFTSSTCEPCVQGNEHVDALLNSNTGDYSLIKYQTDFPPPGDDYYTEEVGIRMNYYGVVLVPWLFTNSVETFWWEFTQEDFDQFKEEVTNVGINISHASINEEHEIICTIKLNPLENIEAGKKLHMAIIEKTTTGNVGSNGETEFHHVLMKMLPNAEGTTLESLIAGEEETVSHSFDMDNTNMEEANDLKIVAFIQDHETKEILNSEMIDVTYVTSTSEIENKLSVSIYPNPVKNILYFSADENIESIEILTIDGAKVFERTNINNNKSSIDLSNIKSGIYISKIRYQNFFIEKKKIVVF